MMLDRTLVQQAKEALGAHTNSEAIEQALTRVVQQKAMQDLAKWVVETDPTFTAASRRKAR